MHELLRKLTLFPLRRLIPILLLVGFSVSLITLLTLYRSGYRKNAIDLHRTTAQHSVEVLVHLLENDRQLFERGFSLLVRPSDTGIVLITDQNVRETLDIVDRAYILHDGVVLMQGAPSEIVANKDVRRVYLGERFSL